LRRELNNKGFEGVVTEEVIREGKKAEVILKQIDEDEDVSVLVLGASTEASGPGPLVAAFTNSTPRRVIAALAPDAQSRPQGSRRVSTRVRRSAIIFAPTATAIGTAGLPP